MVNNIFFIKIIVIIGILNIYCYVLYRKLSQMYRRNIIIQDNIIRRKIIMEYENVNM